MKDGSEAASAETQTDTTADTGSTETVPAAVSEALAGLFPSSRPTMDGTQEEQDELEQDGLVDPNDPDGQTKAPEVSDVEPAETEEAAATPEDDKPVVEAGKDGATVLDPFLRYIAGESGFTDDKIAKLMAADPELAVQTFQTLADSYTALSRQYVTPGSPLATGTPAVTAQPPQQQPTTPTPKLDQFMAQLAAFSEANGEDMGNFAKLVNDELATPLKALIAQNAVREQELVREQSLSAFNAVRKDFGDFYGPETGNLSDGQRQARQNVAVLADQIRAGAKAQGREVSIKDAISRAHAVVTADLRAATARKQVTDAVQKRAKGITAKPTQRRSPAQVLAGTKSDEAALAAYEQLSANIGHETGDNY